MMTIRAKTLFLCACVLETAWLLIAQAIGSTLLLLPCLVCFLALVVWAAIRNSAMPIFLFFLPFSPLLKLAPGTISFFTIALMAVYLVYMVTSSRNVPVHHLVPALCLIALTLTVKTLSGYSIDNSYILFCFTLLLVPYISSEKNGRYDFFWLTLSFGLGIVLAASSAQFLMSSSNIAPYVNVSDVLGIVRRSGYYGDPNFYSAHITAALGGVLVLLLNQKRKSEIVVLVLLAAALIYCGFLSVSKSFLLVALCMVLFWLVGLMFSRGKISAKLMILLTAVVGVCFLLSTTVFDMMLSRFVGNADLSAFTTGRTDLWANYIQALGDNPMMLLFGNGYSNVWVNGRASHNTLIQMIYQFGLVGCGLFIYWVVCFVRTLLAGVKTRRSRLAQVAILLIGAFGPWMALDYLFFDEFFLFPIYVCAAIRFMVQQEPVESPLIEQKSVGE